MYVPHLYEAPVSDADDVMSRLDFGAKIRATAQTNMNSQSSRSHSLFIMRVTKTVQEDVDEDGGGGGEGGGGAAAAAKRPKDRVARMSNRKSTDGRIRASNAGKRPGMGGSGSAGGPGEKNKKKYFLSSTINMIDLAGSERVKKAGHHRGGRMIESSNINTSLSVLGLVISKLAAGAHDPKRRGGREHVGFAPSI